jgi:hypothetical protein
LVLWLGTENTIKGKVMASPKSGPWWVLWVDVCPWFIHAPKVANYALCCNPILEDCEDDIHTLEMGTWESSGILKTSEFNCKGQNSLPWGVFYIIKKLLKCRCQKWPCMSHLDICSTSYGKKKRSKVKLAIWLPTTKSHESTWPWCVQVEYDTPLESSQGKLQVFFRPYPNRRFKQRVMNSQSPGSLNRDNFGTPPWESRDKKPFECRCCGETQKILYGGRWWLPLSPGCGESGESRVVHDLSQHQGCSRMWTNQLVGWFNASSSK